MTLEVGNEVRLTEDYLDFKTGTKGVITMVDVGVLISKLRFYGFMCGIYT